MNCIDDLDELWFNFQECSESIQQNTRRAQELLIQFSELFETPDSTAGSELPSSEPVDMLPIRMFASTFSSEDRDLEADWGTCQTMSLTARTARELWKEWKEGSDKKPSAEYMNWRYGDLKWTTSEEQHTYAVAGAIIIREIELHLENGRELDEILVVADLILADLGCDMKRLARRIMDNSERSRATFFEVASSSEIVSGS